MKSLKGYRSPIPKNSERELIEQVTDFRDNEINEEISRHKEMREEVIFGIESDLEELDDLKNRPDLADPESIYNQLKGLKKNDESFLFRNILGRGFPDSVAELSRKTSISETDLKEVYEEVYEGELAEEKALTWIELMQYESASDLIELRADPAEDLDAAREELETVRYHLRGVADRSRERYRELTEEIEESFRSFVRNQEDTTEEDFFWNAETYGRY
jgi:hypothetical protein